jgi:CheY-like chemotaxis protein
LDGPATAIVTERPSSQGLRVLVVEDEPETALTMSVLLALWGHEARVARDGPSAVEAVRDSVPDVVLLDLLLPGRLDGCAVAEHVRELCGARRPLLIALTGLGGELDRRRCEKAGIDLCLVKPIEPDHLQSLLRDYLAALVE